MWDIFLSKPDSHCRLHASCSPQLLEDTSRVHGSVSTVFERRILFTTESYGGHYGPIFNEYIERQNAKADPGSKNINLKGVLIGNGWYDPLIQYAAYYNFTVFPGNTYDYAPYNKVLSSICTTTCSALEIATT